MAMMGAESVDYHRATIVERSDDHPGRALDYYASRSETPLVWGGSGAARLGLSGTVTDGQYSAIFGAGGAADPTTGVRLVGTRRPGMELVVSAHKSVAELGVMGRAPVMHRILDAERDATLAYLDAATRERGGRRGRRRTQTATSGLISAHTRHATSRAGDPCPHDHVLVANVVEMGDAGGGWKAADTALWREELHAATMVGRVAAARAAVEAGFAIEADPGPSGRLRHWRIAGIPDEVVAVHSKRSAEIDAHLAGTGFGSPRARAVAARETRKAKRFEGADKLTVRWRKELAAAGWPVSRLLDSVEQAGHSVSLPGVLSTAELERVVRKVLEPDGALARRKVFGRGEMIVAVAPLLFGRPISDLDRAVGAVLADAAVVPLVGVADARDRQYTLAATIATELAIAATVAEGAAPAGAGVVPAAAVAEAVARVEDQLGRSLTDGQADAVHGICRGGCPVSLVMGVAGSGKTTCVAAVADAYRRSGYRVLGTATSGQAARTLGREAGLELSSTLASLLWRLDDGRLRLDNRDAIVLDEAGMTDDPDLLRVLAAAQAAGAKAILIGDDHQLGPVGPGGALGALLRRHEGVVHVLDENVRQTDAAERRALSELRAGSVEAAVAWYREAGRIRCAPDRDTAVAAVVDGWAADVAAGRDAVMLAWRRHSVERLNHSARQAWARMGRLEGPEVEAPGGRRYAAGDLVVALAPAANGSVVTSQRGIVVGVHPGPVALDVRLDDGVVVRLAGEQLGAERLGYSYGLTVHRAQGLTARTCHHLADGGGRELAYVAMSRARTSTVVHLVADDVDQAAEDLSREWGRRTRPRWAIDMGAPSRRHVQSCTMVFSPTVAERLAGQARLARLRAERDALRAAIPPQVNHEVAAVDHDCRRIGEQLDQLRHGRYHGDDSVLAEHSRQLSEAADQRALAQQALGDQHLGWLRRRHWTRELARWTDAEAAQRAAWQELAAPELERLKSTLERLERSRETVSEQNQASQFWFAQHPEADERLRRLDNLVAVAELDARRPHRPTPRSIRVPTGQTRRQSVQPWRHSDIEQERSTRGRGVDVGW
jgi:conjugative relaxase-like TrwC/TraI family protein